MNKKERTFRGIENMNENHFKVFADDGVYFVSYGFKIVYKPWDGTPEIDREKWDYSKTTSKYRAQFLGETTKETAAKIKSGAYILANLN